MCYLAFAFVLQTLSPNLLRPIFMCASAEEDRGSCTPGGFRACCQAVLGVCGGLRPRSLPLSAATPLASGAVGLEVSYCLEEKIQIVL